MVGEKKQEEKGEEKEEMIKISQGYQQKQEENQQGLYEEEP